MEKLSGKNILEIFVKIKDTMVENKDSLCELDAVLGDGDLGLSMSNGFSKVSDELLNYSENRVGKIIMKAGMVLAEEVPSTMGTLIADGLISAGKSLGDKTEIDLADLSLFFSQFVNRIIITGKAQFGEKTLVDSLYPASKTIEAFLDKDSDYKTVFKSAYESAKEGSQSTKKLISKYGRAKWFGEKSIGKEDPGAVAGVYFVKAFNDYFQSFII